MKQIDSAIIDEALAGIDEEKYRETLIKLAESKLNTLKEEDPHKRQAKLMSFLASHGFTPEEVGKLIIDN